MVFSGLAICWLPRFQPIVERPERNSTNRQRNFAPSPFVFISAAESAPAGTAAPVAVGSAPELSRPGLGDRNHVDPILCRHWALQIEAGRDNAAWIYTHELSGKLRKVKYQAVGGW